jgi:uncharacterized OB-fold protein
MKPGFEKFGLVSYVRETRIAGFIERLQQGEICGTRCVECGTLQFPPRAHCIKCLSSHFEWNPLSGDCHLITFTRVDAAPAAFKEQAPYFLGLAELSEGPKAFASIDKQIPEDQITVGMKMQLRIVKLSNGNYAYTLNEAR